MNDIVLENLKIKEFQAISLAYSELKKKLQDDEGYVISAFFEGSSLVVTFRKRPSSPGVRGNLSENPSLEVVIDMNRMEVVHSAFTR